MKTLFIITVALWVLSMVMYSIGPRPGEDYVAWVPIAAAGVCTIVLVVWAAAQLIITGAL